MRGAPSLRSLSVSEGHRRLDLLVCSIRGASGELWRWFSRAGWWNLHGTSLRADERVLFSRSGRPGSFSVVGAVTLAADRDVAREGRRHKEGFPGVAGRAREGRREVPEIRPCLVGVGLCIDIGWSRGAGLEEGLGWGGAERVGLAGALVPGGPGAGRADAVVGKRVPDAKGLWCFLLFWELGGGNPGSAPACSGSEARRESVCGMGGARREEGHGSEGGTVGLCA